MGNTWQRMAIGAVLVAGVTGSATLSAVAGSPSRCLAGRDYELVTSLVTWEEARLAALAAGGHLVNISSEKENACVLEIADGHTSWIGGSDAAEEGTWRWAGVKKGVFWRGDGSGTAYGYENWYPDQPDDSGGEEDCLAMLSFGSPSDGTWNDGTCDTPLPYIIEY